MSERTEAWLSVEVRTEVNCATFPVLRVERVLHLAATRFVLGRPIEGDTTPLRAGQIVCARWSEGWMAQVGRVNEGEALIWDHDWRKTVVTEAEGMPLFLLRLPQNIMPYVSWGTSKEPPRFALEAPCAAERALQVDGRIPDDDDDEGVSAARTRRSESL